MVEKLLTVGFHHMLRTLPGMTRFGGAHPPKNPQPPNAASLLPQNSLKVRLHIGTAENTVISQLGLG